MSKHQERINIINLLYRHFLLHHDVLTTKQEAYDFSQVVSTNEESKQVKTLLNHLPEIITIINTNLKLGWTFERLSNYHKAVLTYGVFAIKYQEIAKAIIINECLEILKKFGEDTDISYINSVLDQI